MPDGAPLNSPTNKGYAQLSLIPKIDLSGFRKGRDIRSAIPKRRSIPFNTNTGNNVGITALKQSSIPRWASFDAVDENIRNMNNNIRQSTPNTAEMRFFAGMNYVSPICIFLITIFDEKRNNALGRIKKLLTAVTELPQSAFGECPYIEIEVDSAFKLDGCREILAYGEESVSLLTDMGIITVSGRALELRSYGNSTIRITGRIMKVEIGEGMV